MFFATCFLLLVVGQLGQPAHTADSPNYRIMHLEDLLNDPSWQLTHKHWSTPKSGLISRVALHSNSNSVFVAVNNSVLRFSADMLEKLDEVSWSLSREQSKTCQKRSENNLVNCATFTVTLLTPVDGAFSAVTSSLFRTGIFVCISTGRTSECSLRQAADLRGPPKVHWKGTKYCPSNRGSQLAVTYASNRHLYIGGKFDETLTTSSTIVSISEHLIDESSSSNVQFTKLPTRTNWIFQDDQTAFILSFEYHDAVYFLFREPAKELIDGCKKFLITSRIGRICLVDGASRSERLQTFVKATIVCPSASEAKTETASFVHSALQSANVDQSTKSLFAVFTTPSTMPASSVLCEYRLTEIEKVFEGSFHTFHGKHTKFDNPVQCHKPDSTATSELNMPPDSRLMHNMIRPRTGQAILMQEGMLWRHISIDWVPQTPKSDNNLIAFIMDSEDILTKWHLFKSETCLIEQINMHRHWDSRQSAGETIHMQLIQDQSKPTLLIATSNSVYRLPVARCGRLGHEERACALLHDPYCAWNRQTQRCQDLHGISGFNKQLTKYETCPSDSQEPSSLIVHGAWGAWSSWSSCSMSHNRSLYARWLSPLDSNMASNNWEYFKPLIVNHCQCRHRFCSAPYRFGPGAETCHGGAAIQLTNCSVDGMWTAWSSWSECEPGCEQHRQYKQLQGVNRDEDWRANEGSVRIRTRQRWCTNPSPMGELGKSCTDVGKESQTCSKSDISCPADPSPTPTWSKWSEWSECSSACNGGVQLRWRKCSRGHQFELSQPAALKFSLPSEKVEQETLEECLGEAYESRACNNHSCPVTKVTSSWTAWYITDGNRQKGTKERRYRVECVATVPEVDKLQAEIHLQNGNCHTDSTGIITCQDINSKEATDMTESESFASSDYGWSAWTLCSRPCGGGVRTRWRLRSRKEGNILSSFDSAALINSEAEKEEELCNAHPCPGRWSCWTAWSKCTHPPCSAQRGEQRRYRSCLISSNAHLADGQEPTVNQCDGGEEQSVQSRPCEVTFEELQCQLDAVSQKKRTTLTEQEPFMDPNRERNMRSPWAEWSECFPVNGLAYEIKVRAREHCEGCELVQAKRCDTQEAVSIDELLQHAPHLGTVSSTTTTTTTDEQESAQYGMAHAIIAGLCGAALGIAVVLIPYLICVNHKRGKSKKCGHQNAKRLNSERNLPYIRFASAGRSNSDKTALQQMVLQRNRVPSPIEPATRPVTEPKVAEQRHTENIGDSPSTLRTQASVARAAPCQNASLKRIQALHNDHRNAAMPQSTSPLSFNEPMMPWDHTNKEKTGMNPAFVDSSPMQRHVDQAPVFSPSPLSTYDPTVDGVNTLYKSPSPLNTQMLVSNTSTPNDEIIYASAPCSYTPGK